MSITAMQQALEALEYIDNNYMSLPKIGNKSITALRTAIEAAEKQEPVAWMDVGDKGEHYSLRFWSEPENRNEVPLYIAPPAAQRQWVGLTDEQIKTIEKMALTKNMAIAMTTATLKEKNT